MPVILAKKTQASDAYIDEFEKFFTNSKLSLYNIITLINYWISKQRFNNVL